MKKINRIISIITSLSLTFVSSTYIASAKKIDTQSSSSNQSETAKEQYVIVKLQPTKEGQVKAKAEPIPYGIDPRITDKNANLLRNMGMLLYGNFMFSIGIVSSALSIVGVGLELEILSVASGTIGAACICSAVSFWIRLFLMNQSF